MKKIIYNSRRENLAEIFLCPVGKGAVRLIGIKTPAPQSGYFIFEVR